MIRRRSAAGPPAAVFPWRPGHTGPSGAGAVWRCAWLLLCVFSLAAGTLGVALPAAAQASSAWLDQSPPSNWNQRGASVPNPPAATLVAPDECAAQERAPQGTEEQQVSDRGWRLTAPSQTGAGGVRVVLGQIEYDGMCRPMGYQEFVFVNGSFTGTISPTPMNSRTDGSGSVQGVIGPDTLTAVFSRYADSDPLCCPSRTTTVTYRLDRGPSNTVLLPTSTATVSTAPAPAPSSGSWLDQSPPANWNVRNGTFPTPPPDSVSPNPACLAQAKTPSGPEESAVAGAGWRLFDAPAVGAAAGGLKVVSGTAGYDGMCRPMAYNQFVFVDGGFIGTISPVAMDSRTDGAGGVQGAIGPETLTAVFSRYADSDPLCCASQQTTVTYRVDRSAAPLLLVPTSATTGVPGATPTPAPDTGPLANLAPGTVVALRGTPHLWLAAADGALHWLGDTRALAGQPVSWDSRVEVDAPTLRAARIGDPFLSAGLVRRNGPIYLAKWEQGQAQPTLLHIQSIGDLSRFGITGDNYGRFVLEEPAWNQRYGFTAAGLPTGELQPAA